MHRDVLHARLRDDRRHRGIRETGGDVVDDLGARLDGGEGGGGAHRVHTHPDAAAREFPHDRHDAAKLLLGLDACGAGTRGLAADIEQVGAVGDELEPVRDRGIGVEPAAAVAEGVGRDVDDAHDERRVSHLRGPR